MSKTGNSYSSILKSSSLIGGSQFVMLAIGIIRTKFVAVFLGPSGVGLIGTYMAIQQFSAALAGMGINQSAVRDISGARGSEDPQRIAETVAVLRKLSLWLGLLGAFVLAALAWPLSRLTFGDDAHVIGIMALGVSVFLGLISAAQSAILQGFRQIAKMAKAGICGTIIGSSSAVLWYYYLGVDGIIPAIVTLSLVSLTFTWLYARTVEVTPVVLNWAQLIPHAKSLLSLGLAFMWNGLLLAALAYIVRMIVLKEFDLVAVGIYSAAFGISGMVVNFVLGAMAADYFPRLSEAADNHPRMVKLVNEQVEIGVLLALPAIIGLIVFAPWIIKILYTAEFVTAIPLIQWFGLGCLGRVIQWPLGFVVLALKRGGLFAGIESLLKLTHIAGIYYFIAHFGLVGVSIAFSVNYVVYYGIIIITVSKLIGFKWSTSATRLVLSAIAMTVLIFVLSIGDPRVWLQCVTITLWLGTGLICLRGLVMRVGTHPKLEKILDRCPAVLRKLLIPTSN